MANSNKTKPEETSVDDFLAAVEPAKRREDALAVCALMREATGVEPVMWGPSMVGFGSYHYKYASGREGDWLVVGFSPRKAALTLYGLKDYEENAEAVDELGPVTTGKGCVYVKDLEKIDLDRLRELTKAAFADKQA